MPQKNWFDLPPLSLHEMTTDVSTNERDHDQHPRSCYQSPAAPQVLIPCVQTRREKLGENAMREVLDATIRKLAADDGAAWAETYGQTTASLRTVAQELWAGSGSESDDHLDFNVTHCQCAEFYKELGLSDIGYRVHCNRDHAMVVGFDGELELSRRRHARSGLL